MRSFENWAELAANREQMEERIRAHMAHGVSFVDASVYLAEDVTIGAGTVILPGVILLGGTSIGAHCIIGPNAVIGNSTIGDHTTVNASEITDCTLGEATTVGPFAHLRGGCIIGDHCRVGNFVELKNTRMANGSKSAHLSYLGDAELGESVNMGCGSITVNYDGVHKHKTIIGDRAFIGCNANLIAPVTIGADTLVAAGSTIAEDVPDGALAIARSRQTVKPDRAKLIFAKKREQA